MWKPAPAARACRRTSGRSLDEFPDGGAELVDGLLVALLDGVHDAVAQMILEDDLAGVVQRAADSRKLHQHLAAVAAVLDHLPDFFKMADGAGQPVDNGLLVFMDMAVRVGVIVAVAVRVFVRMVMRKVMRIRMFVRMRRRRRIIRF